MTTGVGKGFAPSPAAANAALGGTVRQDAHPAGVEGTRYSLSEMGRLIKEGRNDPRVRAWAGTTISRAEAAGLAKRIDPSAWVESDKTQAGFTVRARTKAKVLAEASAVALHSAWQELCARLRGMLGAGPNDGRITKPRAQAQALLDEVRRVTHYVQDPVGTELMAKPHVTVCLDDFGLCMPSADCFPEGTLLLRDDLEFVPIERICIGDRIWGYDKWSVVQNKWEKGELNLDAIRLSNDATLLLTRDHKVWLDRDDGDPCERITVAELERDDMLPRPMNEFIAAAAHRELEKGGGGSPFVVEIQRNFTRKKCWDIATDDHFVYLPEHDVTVSQCDDRCVLLLSGLMSIGIDARAVGEAYGTEQATHVIGAFRDEDAGEWVKVDPSHERWPVGETHPSTKSWWLDPLSGSISEDAADGMKSTLGKEPENGDFIGVGAVPERAPEGTGIFPFAHAFSPLAHGASYVPVGLESGLPCEPDGTECGEDGSVIAEFACPPPATQAQTEPARMTAYNPVKVTVPPAEPVTPGPVGMGINPQPLPPAKLPPLELFQEDPRRYSSDD
jgi:hypothetical protein